MIAKVACGARVHFWIVDSRYLRWRCRDRRCPAVIKARQLGLVAIHVWDLETDQMWDDFEAAEPQTKEDHHGPV